MRAILSMLFRKLQRSPMVFILMSALTLLFSFVLMSSISSKLIIYVFADQEKVAEEWSELLNQSEAYKFKIVSEEKAKTAVAEHNVEMALEVKENNYQIYQIAENPNVKLVDNYVRGIFERELRFRSLGEDRIKVEEELENPVIQVHSPKMGQEEKNMESYQPLFGFALFFVIYTITFAVADILEERRVGIWDRMILSPLTKTRIYLGHLFYSFLIGYVQLVLMFFIFQYGFGLDLNLESIWIWVGLALYVLSIVAFGVLLTGLVRSIQQYNALIPIVSVSMAMIGGAYWPLELVTNPILLTLSKIVPVTYGMNILKEAVIFENSISVMLPWMIILLLFTTICTGVGINLMERRTT